VVIIAGGWAITRAIGLAQFLEPLGHDFTIVHSRRKGKPYFHKAYLTSLKEKGHYKPYVTDVGIPRINESYGEIPSLTAVVAEQYGENVHYVLCGPDASEAGVGEFETSLSHELQSRGIPEDQIFLSTW